VAIGIISGRKLLLTALYRAEKDDIGYENACF